MTEPEWRHLLHRYSVWSH